MNLLMPAGFYEGDPTASGMHGVLYKYDRWVSEKKWRKCRLEIYQWRINCSCQAKATEYGVNISVLHSAITRIIFRSQNQWLTDLSLAFLNCCSSLNFLKARWIVIAAYMNEINIGSAYGHVELSAQHNTTPHTIPNPSIHWHVARCRSNWSQSSSFRWGQVPFHTRASFVMIVWLAFRSRNIECVI